MLRIGIDVGGTNTDAVLMEGRSILGGTKSATTPEVTEGIINALNALIEQTGVEVDALQMVMIGTTHFTNALVERKKLAFTACLRLGLPAGESLPPMVDMPEDLVAALKGRAYLAHGGSEFNGRIISELRPDEILSIAQEISAEGVESLAIVSIFSPMNPVFEQRAAEIVREVVPDLPITLSHTIGGIGLLERENATIINAALRPLAAHTIRGLRLALKTLNIHTPFYLSQNDGTLISAEMAEQHPILTFASGPTNSMRGAAFLSGIQDAIVIDIGGTTSDIGILQKGFPRISNNTAYIGGVRTNFRMPDTLSIGLGGGSIIQDNPLRIGPQSVGYEITSRARVFGGDVLTASDVIVAGGRATMGTSEIHLDADFIERVENQIATQLSSAVDQMKTNAAPVPVILVGGGSILLTQLIEGATEIIRPDYFACANAIGAAIAQVSGEVEQIVALDGTDRQLIISQIAEAAIQRAVENGANPRTVEVTDVEEIALAYLPGGVTRIRVRAVGGLID